jgi:regulator of cell morphogenesis and NO signaling
MASLTPHYDGLVDLVDHIVSTHHTFTRAALGRLVPLADSVAKAHGTRHPELLVVRAKLHEMATMLLRHMNEEEACVFPYFCALERGGPLVRNFGGVVRPLAVMRRMHEAVTAILDDLERLTHGFTPPWDASNGHRALYEGVEALDRDFDEHVRLEEEVAFPRAVALERESSQLRSASPRP